MGLRPKPALLFLIAEKDPAGRLAKKLAPRAAPCGPPSAGQTYFELGILQLPTVKQIKRLYIPFKIGFISRFKRGHLTANNNGEQPE